MKRMIVVVCALLIVALSVGATAKQITSDDIVYPSDNAPASVKEGAVCWNLASYLTYADLADKSKVVVVADVLDTFTAADRHSPEKLISYATVRVAEVIKGDVKKGDSILVQDNGYICVDDVGAATAVYSNSGGPLMEKGNRVLLFLNVPTSALASHPTLEEDSYYVVTQWSIGVFFYDADGRYHAAARYANHIALRGWMLYDYEPKTLRKIKKLSDIT